MSLIAEGTGYNYGSIHGGGAIRWQAPELIDPEAFGLEGTRPTSQSDVFSIACTAIEVYSGMPPLPTLKDHQVVSRYIRGERPPQPCLPGGQIMRDDMWSILEAYWAQKHMERISVREVVARLATIVQSTTSSSVEQLTTRMDAIDVQDSVRSGSFISVLASFAVFKNLPNPASHSYSPPQPEQLAQIYRSYSEKDRGELRESADLIVMLIIARLRLLSRYWEDLANCTNSNPSLNSDLSCVASFLWMWSSRIVHDRMPIPQPRIESEVDLPNLLRNLLGDYGKPPTGPIADEAVLFASRCQDGGNWVPTGRGGYCCDCRNQHKIAADTLHKVLHLPYGASPVTRDLGDPHTIRSIALFRGMVHVLALSRYITATPILGWMSDAKRAAFLASDDARAVASLIIVMLDELCSISVENEHLHQERRPTITRSSIHSSSADRLRSFKPLELIRLGHGKGSREASDIYEQTMKSLLEAEPVNHLNLVDIFDRYLRPLKMVYEAWLGMLQVEGELNTQISHNWNASESRS